MNLNTYSSKTPNNISCVFCNCIWFNNWLLEFLFWLRVDGYKEYAYLVKWFLSWPLRPFHLNMYRNKHLVCSLMLGCNNSTKPPWLASFVGSLDLDIVWRFLSVLWSKCSTELPYSEHIIELLGFTSQDLTTNPLLVQDLFRIKMSRIQYSPGSFWGWVTTGDFCPMTWERKSVFNRHIFVVISLLFVERILRYWRSTMFL